MNYETPTLTLVGAAQQLVLGVSDIPKCNVEGDNPIDPPYTDDELW